MVAYILVTAIEAVMAELIGQHLCEVEYRLHSMDLQTRLRREGDKDYGPPDGGPREDRVNLTTTRQGKVISFEVA